MKKIEFYSPVFESGNEKELLLDCLRNKDGLVSKEVLRAGI